MLPEKCISILFSEPGEVVYWTPRQATMMPINNNGHSAVLGDTGHSAPDDNNNGHFMELVNAGHYAPADNIDSPFIQGSDSQHAAWQEKRSTKSGKNRFSHILRKSSASQLANNEKRSKIPLFSHNNNGHFMELVNAGHYALADNIDGHFIQGSDSQRAAWQEKRSTKSAKNRFSQILRKNSASQLANNEKRFKTPLFSHKPSMAQMTMENDNLANREYMSPPQLEGPQNQWYFTLLRNLASGEKQATSTDGQISVAKRPFSSILIKPTRLQQREDKGILGRQSKYESGHHELGRLAKRSVGLHVPLRMPSAKTKMALVKKRPFSGILTPTKAAPNVVQIKMVQGDFLKAQVNRAFSQILRRGGR